MFLYIIICKEMFKIGVSIGIERPINLAKTTYKSYGPDLSNSYLFFYKSTEIMKKLEKNIKYHFKEYLFDKNIEGHTECFKIECLNMVLKYIYFFIDLSEEKIELVMLEGIGKDAKLPYFREKMYDPKNMEYCEIYGDYEFLYYLKKYKGNISYKFTGKSGELSLKIYFHVQDVEKIRNDLMVEYHINYKRESWSVSGSSTLAEMDIFSKINKVSPLVFIIEIVGYYHKDLDDTIAFEHPKILDFYEKVFEVLELPTIKKVIDTFEATK